MIYRQLGQSSVKLSAVTMGAWAIGGWLWGGSDDAKAVAAIHQAIDVGMTSIDTAPVYGFGHSEEMVGQAVAGRREKVQILTKYCLRWDKAEGEFYFESKDNHGQPVRIHKNARPASVLWEAEQSLKRLGTDYIDLYQCHWRDPTTPVAETAGAVASLIKQGKVLAAGVSNFTPQDMEEFRRVCPLASDQPPYSMVRRDIEQDVLPYGRASGIGVIVYSPLQLGLLTGKVTMDREFPPGDLRSSSPYFGPENRRLVLEFMEHLRPIAQTHQTTLAQLVINWTIHRPGITAALVGARNPQQAQENAAAADIVLSGQEMARIDKLVDGLKLEL